MLEGHKLLITGPAGQIAFPMARALARRNEVWGIARFSDPASRKEVEEAGIRTLAVDLGRPDFSELPRDFTHLLHLAAAIQGDDCDGAIRTNAEGTGLLLLHCRGVGHAATAAGRAEAAALAAEERVTGSCSSDALVDRFHFSREIG